jgi:hypothetical protein
MNRTDIKCSPTIFKTLESSHLSKFLICLDRTTSSHTCRSHMVSGKDRLYLTLHVRGTGGYHWGLLLCPKAESDNSDAYAYDITNNLRDDFYDPVTGALIRTPPGAWWHRMARIVYPVRSHALVARILITKLPEARRTSSRTIFSTSQS